MRISDLSSDVCSSDLQPGFLLDGAAVLDDLDLAPRLVLDGLLHEAHGVHVLDLAARAVLVARLAHGDVDVTAHAALVHVAVAGAETDGKSVGEGKRV